MREGFFNGFNPEFWKAKIKERERGQAEPQAKNKSAIVDNEIEEHDVADMLFLETEVFGRVEKGKEKFRQYQVEQYLAVKEAVEEDKLDTLEHQNLKEKREKEIAKEEVEFFGKQENSGEASIQRRGVVWGNEFHRYGEVAHSDGESIEDAAISLNIVKGEGAINFTEMAAANIDSEGSNDPSELDPESTTKALNRGGRELVERYLENIFRRFDGQVYKVGNVNDYALGHSADLSSAENDLVYALPYSKASEMNQLVENGASILCGNEEVEFSHQTGMNIDALQENDYGFTRNIKVDGKAYTVKFVYLKETNDNMEEDGMIEVV